MTELLNTFSGHLLEWVRTTLKILAIIVLGWLSIRLGLGVVGNVFKKREGSPIIEDRRAKTLVAVLTSLIRYVVDFTVVVTILAALDINTSTILVGAGVASLAVGFGAQNLVRDVITGFFLLFEDQFSVGDYVTAAGVSGTVEEVGLRATKLRDFSGEVHIVPNGIIDKTTNHSRGDRNATVTVTVPYGEPVDRVLAVLNQVADGVAAEKGPVLVVKPYVLGITAFGDTGVVLTMMAKTVPMAQWEVERALRIGIKRAFEKEGIRVPTLALPAGPSATSGAPGTEGRRES